MKKEYALYRGDDMIAIGTIAELAKARGVKEDTIRFYGAPIYQKRGRGTNGKRLALVKLED